MRRKYFYGILSAILISGCAQAENLSSTAANSSIIIQDKTEKNELTIQDILISEDECLKNTPFMAGSVECILAHYSDMEQIRSEEGANGYFNYWIGDGIEYITYSEDPDIAGVVIKGFLS